MSYYIGLMSGTSMDAVDAALVKIDGDRLELVSSSSFPYPEKLQQQLRVAIDPKRKFTLDEFGTLDSLVAGTFGSAATALLEHCGVSAKEIEAIGSHGQTLRHSPNTSPPYTIQIGNGAIVAAHTKIDTVSDFRSLDVARGGQGAPLVPAFHEWLFRSSQEDRVVLNIGGIANITILPRDQNLNISGFDTGPGNCLMDDWCQKCVNQPYDQFGEWAAIGTCNEALLAKLMEEDYFQQKIPKSTGREKFNLDWLFRLGELSKLDKLATEDVQATLLQLTIRTITNHINRFAPSTATILVCGGGVFNRELLKELRTALPERHLATTSEYGLDANMLEACAFAWLAYCRKSGIPVRLTTRPQPVRLVLGALHAAPL